ncbi:hypothetical protein RAS1_00810 [Phycisphaerae bacterium RAS1]|nr:hypothetical protein RAS1_00810 [Phycisphaerae bacterium RAS1]
MSMENPPPESSPVGGPDVAQLKSAMKAFKKRLKMARLDDESRLGHGPMSSGGSSGIVAIVPPNQFPQSVWDELTRQGKIRRAGQGLYELTDER